MFELNLPTAATILGIVVAVSTLIGKFLGNKNAIEKKSYEDGVKETKILNKLDELSKTLEDMQNNYATQASLQLLTQKVEVLECKLKSFDRRSCSS